MCYNKNMKKIITLLLILFVGLSVNAKTKKVSGLSDNQLVSMNKSVDYITRKMYSGAFLSPSDTSALIGIKIKLDDNMLLSPDTRYAPLYYKLGKIYQRRAKKQEAIECYQAILENFPDTALAPKAAFALKQMGVNVVMPKRNSDSSDDE